MTDSYLFAGFELEFDVKLALCKVTHDDVAEDGLGAGRGFGEHAFFQLFANFCGHHVSVEHFVSVGLN